jgi:hypothetical protein
VDLDDSDYFTNYTPSAIASIDGIDTTTYLEWFAGNNSFGTLEPHADWNQLMSSAAQDIQALATVFAGGATFYPGDTITFKLENGTVITDNWKAIYYSQGNTGPLETGGDFFNFFVLGFYPASYDPDLIDNNTVNITDLASASSSTSAAAAAPTVAVASATPDCTETWGNLAYPACPDVAQSGLGSDDGAVVSGKL